MTRIITISNDNMAMSGSGSSVSVSGSGSSGHNSGDDGNSHILSGTCGSFTNHCVLHSVCWMRVPTSVFTHPPNTGISRLPDDVLDLHIKPACTLPSRLNLFQVSRLFKTLMAVGMPRQSMIVVRHNGYVKYGRAPVLRLSREPPCLEETQAPFRMRLDAESELNLEYATIWSNKPVQDVLGVVELIVVKMRHALAQPVQTFRIASIPVTDEAVGLLYQNFPPSVRATVHTLCVRHQEVFHSRTASLFPYVPCVFPLVTTVKLHKTAVDIAMLFLAAPSLTSLQVSECPKTQGWPILANMTGLRDLRLSAYNMHDATNVRPAMDAITGATWLTSVQLMGFGTQGCVALAGFTALTSLCLSSMLNDTSNPSTFSAHLDEIARRSPGLRRLGLAVRPGVMVPSGWRQLEDVHVLHKTRVPYLDSIRNLVIEKTLAPYDAYPLDYSVLAAFPRNLVTLCVSYNALLSAVGCDELRQLSWTPVSRDGEFQLSHHVSLLVAVSQEAGAWPLLDRLLILQESMSQSGQKTSREDRDLQNTYNAQLLQTLASRTPCNITHVTIQQGEHGPGTFEALCKMPVLHSVTLIGMVVNITRLRNLLRKPCMRLIELIGVVGVDAGQVEMLRKEARPGGKILSMELCDLDVARTGAFDWIYS